jgi:hypothetical protein
LLTEKIGGIKATIIERDGKIMMVRIARFTATSRT